MTATMVNNFDYMNTVEFRAIKVSDISLADYQRLRKNPRVLRIVKEFDIHRMRPIEVSFRDGKYYCFDGQHRTAAYRVLGIDTIPAIIHYGCDYKREAMLFANQNTNVSKVNNMDRWNAERLAGDAEAVTICKICKDYGYTVAEKRVDARHNIHCVASLQKLIRDQGENGLVWVMRMISRCWDGLPHAVSSDIVDGLASIKKIYGYKMDEKRLESVLKKVTPDLLIRDAGKFRQGVYGRNDKRGIPVAKTMVGMYNRGYSMNSAKRLVDVYTNW